MKFDFKQIGIFSGSIILLCALFVSVTSGFSFLHFSNALFMCALVFLMLGLFAYLSRTDFLKSFSRRLSSETEEKKWIVFSYSSVILFLVVATILGALSIFIGLFL